MRLLSFVKRVSGFVASDEAANVLSLESARCRLGEERIRFGPDVHGTRSERCWALANECQGRSTHPLGEPRRRAVRIRLPALVGAVSLESHSILSGACAPVKASQSRRYQRGDSNPKAPSNGAGIKPASPASMEPRLNLAPARMGRVVFRSARARAERRYS